MSMQFATNNKAGTLPLDDAAHVLIIDDDQRIRDLLGKYLFEHGFRVTLAKDAVEARNTLRGLEFDLLILDVMMPGESGIELATDLQGKISVPILMLTARSEPGERVEGLEAGVEDYMAKPFEPKELLLRINNILKRQDSQVEMQTEVRMGDYIFYIGRGELKHDNQAVKITERERDLLRQFARQPGVPISRLDLASADGGERAVDVQINRLRRKIEIDPSNPVFLQTVRGKGYILYAE